MGKKRVWEKLQRLQERFLCSHRESKSTMHKRIFYLLVFLAFAGLLQYGKEKYLEWKEAHSGIPDAVSSVSVNNDHHLKVVANSSQIEDKEGLAREIIHMCQDNSFHSIRFSTDINGYPSELHISVYLNRKEVEGGSQSLESNFPRMISVGNMI